MPKYWFYSRESSALVVKKASLIKSQYNHTYLITHFLLNGDFSHARWKSPSISIYLSLFLSRSLALLWYHLYFSLSRRFFIVSHSAMRLLASWLLFKIDVCLFLGLIIQFFTPLPPNRFSVRIFIYYKYWYSYIYKTGTMLRVILHWFCHLFCWLFIYISLSFSLSLFRTYVYFFLSNGWSWWGLL